MTRTTSITAASSTASRFATTLACQLNPVLVLGAATGRVLKHFEDNWGVRAYGCEISRWAHARIPPRYRRRIARADMRRYVPELVRKGRTFDLVFSNCLIYLEAGEIPDFLARL